MKIVATVILVVVMLLVSTFAFTPKPTEAKVESQTIYIPLIEQRLCCFVEQP